MSTLSCMITLSSKTSCKLVGKIGPRNLDPGWCSCGAQGSFFVKKLRSAPAVEPGRRLHSGPCMEIPSTCVLLGENLREVYLETKYSLSHAVSVSVAQAIFGKIFRGNRMRNMKGSSYAYRFSFEPSEISNCTSLAIRVDECGKLDPIQGMNLHVPHLASRISRSTFIPPFSVSANMYTYFALPTSSFLIRLPKSYIPCLSISSSVF